MKKLNLTSRTRNIVIASIWIYIFIMLVNGYMSLAPLSVLFACLMLSIGYWGGRRGARILCVYLGLLAFAMTLHVLGIGGSLQHPLIMPRIALVIASIAFLGEILYLLKKT